MSRRPDDIPPAALAFDPFDDDADLGDFFKQAKRNATRKEKPHDPTAKR